MAWKDVGVFSSPFSSQSCVAVERLFIGVWVMAVVGTVTDAARSEVETVEPVPVGFRVVVQAARSPPGLLARGGLKMGTEFVSAWHRIHVSVTEFVTPTRI
jgi:hypothetical protein